LLEETCRPLGSSARRGGLLTGVEALPERTPPAPEMQFAWRFATAGWRRTACGAAAGAPATGH